MRSPSLAEIQAALSSPPGAQLKPIRVAVLRTCTVEPIEPYLRYAARREGCEATIVFSDYDGLAQEALGRSDGALADPVDLVLVVAPLETLSPRLALEFSRLSADEVADERRR